MCATTHQPCTMKTPLALTCWGRSSKRGDSTSFFPSYRFLPLIVFKTVTYVMSIIDHPKRRLITIRPSSKSSVKITCACVCVCVCVLINPSWSPCRYFVWAFVSCVGSIRHSFACRKYNLRVLIDQSSSIFLYNTIFYFVFHNFLLQCVYYISKYYTKYQVLNLDCVEFHQIKSITEVN